MAIRISRADLEIFKLMALCLMRMQVTLLDMPVSPFIEEYQSEIITEGTQNVIEEAQVYQDKQTIATAMRHYSVMHKFQFRVKRSSHRSYWLICIAENCNWHFKTTSINDSTMFKIRSFNRQHTCTLMDDTFIQRKRTTVVVGSMVMPKYCDPKTVYTPKDIQTDMLSQHGVNRSYMQAWKAKKKALQLLRGHLADSYNKLPNYFYILEKTYPGSVVKLKKTTDECFLYAFVVLCTSISGWKYYGPVQYCLWHMLWLIRKTTHRGSSFLSNSSKHMVKELQWSYTLDEFNERMSKIEEIDPRVKSYLYDIGYHRWSRVHATMNRTWTMTSNIAESLNVVTKEARELPIFDLLEYMRTLLERWTKEKLLKAKGTFTYLGYKFNKELEKNSTLYQKLGVRTSTDHIHTVIDGVKRFIVCLKNKKCSCGQFQFDELPCPHVLAALRHRNETYKNYCSPYYTRESLLCTYEISVNSLPDESKWNVPQHISDEVVNSPMGEKKQPGRPQKERYKTYDELKSKKYKVSCGNYGGEGHNKRSCKNAPKKK
ncbi:uncharacterized protein [Nicotiana sylvestris]|uniref:uncharacterized protein n=1 Tax=Nicotiana sylvestris TaxID=4096 RepID=UPI00388CE6D4